MFVWGCIVLSSPKRAHVHRRTSRGGGGGRGGLQPPQLQKFWKYFGQNVDNSGKSTREKIILKVVKARLKGYFLWRLPCQNGVKVTWSKDPDICFGKAIYRLHVYRRSPRDETKTDSKQTKTYNLGQNLLRHITKIPIFLHSPWQKCLQSQIERPFTPSPIAMLFTVTGEMRPWAVKPKLHCTRGGEGRKWGGGGGVFVPFGHDGCMARKWKLHCPGM